MAFRCQRCGKAQRDGSKPTMIVVEKRNKIYPERYKDGKVIDKGGVGYETARAIQICKRCSGGCDAE